MSDEFNGLTAVFDPPDGVNGALELYSHNMTSTKCDDDGTCYFYIKTVDEVNVIHVYNMYTHPPSFQDVYFWYRGAMVQSWNKFCYQGGMLEVRAQLPGVTDPESGNPDIALGENGKVQNTKFYPTWPGIWMLGNLGRAIFSASTNRMWPYSYDECDADVFDPSFQRISACEDNPGYGLNPNQGRGAPEIDVLEGGGLAISSSLQIAPGMPDNYRLFPVDTSTGDYSYCLYSYNCLTPGANYIDVPTSYYQQERGHKSWYQGLRYAANNYCDQNAEDKQDYDTVAAEIDGGVNHWGVNSNGTCYPLMNSYMGSYLCDPDNTYSKCASPRNASTTPASNAMKPFNYQMDAISSNWPIHFGAYTGFYDYQVEWVTGENGYVRWMLQGEPLFEVTTESIVSVPQNANKTNPKKIMIEEPLYVIFNVALSSSWGTTPPNPGQECRGDGKDPTTNAICDSFPMYLKIDYIRLYQDLGDDLEADNYMQVGCDPASHPTKEWIEGHIDEYEDDDNKWEEVAGKAFCKTSDDCTIGGTLSKTALKTGKCVEQRCECLYHSWGGPRCSTAVSGSSSAGLMSKTFGPPIEAAIAVAIVIILVTMVMVHMGSVATAKKTKAVMAALEAERKAAASVSAAPVSETNSSRGSYLAALSKDNYRQNFV
ncbi:Concanavalin A-like lectin/glucanase domain [Phytophthora cactorum]|nr:Concanavalin A-like lectin/glucanase domain [Phytophthora cactorum]